MTVNGIVNEVYFENAKELYRELSPFGKYSNLLDNFVFRGESTSKYKLIPSALRKENKTRLYQLGSYGKPSGETEYQDEWESWQQKAELMVLKHFFTLADERGILLPDVPILRNDMLNIFSTNLEDMFSEHWLPDELLELAAIAQHYGVPTRFIDWSLNFNISLYFASVNAMKNEVNDSKDEDYIVLWALNFRHLEFLKGTVNKTPLRLIKPAYHRNPNLSAQKGVLTCWEYKKQPSILYTSNKVIINDTRVDRTPLNELLEAFFTENGIDINGQNLMYKFYLPITEAYSVYNAVIKSGYGADALFPGLEGIIQRMKDDTYFKYNKIKQE